MTTWFKRSFCARNLLELYAAICRL